MFTVEEIKGWLNGSESGKEPPDWPVNKANLSAALCSVGIEENDALAMFSDLDVSFSVLSSLTNTYKDSLLVISGSEASITPWSNTDVYNWRGRAEHGNVYLALILLVLCMKCYPDNPATAWDAGHWFYVNLQWQRDNHAVEDFTVGRSY